MENCLKMKMIDNLIDAIFQYYKEKDKDNIVFP